MSKYAKTWWGQRFLAALEDFTDSGRLARGRSYFTDNRIKQWILQNGKVDAKLRGNINPYFGVYKEPTYKVSVQMAHLSEAQWQKITQKLSQRASFIARLLLNEIPENIETVFAEAGVCYRLAGQLDNDPFLLFEMRGLAPDKLLRELANSPLGKVLSDAKGNAPIELMPVDSFYTRPVITELSQEISLKGFWQGQQPLPKSIEPSQAAAIPAMLIKKGGDFPGFWQKQSSFIEVMEDFYLRMRKNALKGL